MSHKKYKRKYLNILLIPDGESSPKNLKLRYSIVTSGIVLAVFLGVVLLVGFFTYGKLLQKAYENISLRQENQQLEQQIQKINELTQELSDLKAYGRKVQTSLMGYVKMSDNPQELAGGASEENLKEQPLVSMLTSFPLKAPVVGFISQEYKPDVHNGIDIVAPEGTPIVASGSGTVLYSGWTMDGGNTIIIGHSNGYYSYYKHNLRNLVYNNQRIEQGEVIAYLGNSGQKSYGPHLHFEIWKDGQPVDPEALISDFK
ncbi:MAG: peptidoglycan DD-metalloendopeptidase family protein [Calditrichia bacterium]